MNSTPIDLGVAVAAIRAAAARKPIRVFLTGVTIEAWPSPAIEELLADAETIYWQAPPPGLNGYELACQVDDSLYRIEVTAPAEALQ